MSQLILSDKGFIGTPFVCEGVTLSISIEGLREHLGLPEGYLAYDQIEKDIRDYFPNYIRNDYNHYNKILNTLYRIIPGLGDYKVRRAEIDLSTHYLEIELIKRF